MINRTNLIWLSVALIAGLGVTYMTRVGDQPMVDVTVPELTPEGQLGLTLFNANCSACHGKNAAGTGNGPPLIHKIYEPNHHGDIAFQRAAKNGVRSHHWQFGNMPPVAGIKKGQVAKIITYVRELQKANGIF